VATLCNLLNIQHDQKTAYHPLSNGLVERFHHRLKDALRACCATKTGQITCRGCCWASVRRPEKTTTTNPLRQCSAHYSFYLANFYIPPELPSDEFLTQFSRMLSTPKHHYTRQNTAATQWPLPKLPDALPNAPKVCLILRCDRHIPSLRSWTRRTRCPHPG
jgi:hypothetical protein